MTLQKIATCVEKGGFLLHALCCSRCLRGERGAVWGVRSVTRFGCFLALPQSPPSQSYLDGPKSITIKLTEPCDRSGAPPCTDDAYEDGLQTHPQINVDSEFMDASEIRRSKYIMEYNADKYIYCRIQINVLQMRPSITSECHQGAACRLLLADPVTSTLECRRERSRPAWAPPGSARWPPGTWWKVNKFKLYS